MTRLTILALVALIAAFSSLGGSVARADLGGTHVAPVALVALGGVGNFSASIGIDHHEPTKQVVMSVNYSTGNPYNFELVASDGSSA